MDYKDTLLEELKNQTGTISFLYENLQSGELISFQPDVPLQAASIIKIPIMVALFHQIKEGKLHLNDKYQLIEEDKKPSCGALNMLHNGLELTLEDLCNLMIILSDNSATNILIRMIGMDTINSIMKELGYQSIQLNRLLFDREASARGIQNYVTVEEIADMLRKMYQGTLVSKESSEQMLMILKNQRLNGKIPFFFTEKLDIAHKTGEDEGIYHDVGIVYGSVPFLICKIENKVDVHDFERFMQETAWNLYQYTEGK